MRHWIVAGMMLAASMGGRAAMPTQVGLLELDGPVTALRVTPDARVAVALMGAAGGRPAGLRVIDLSAAERPALRGGVTGLSGNQLALSADGRQALVATDLEPPQHDEATLRRLVVLDLSDPDQPREVRRQELRARDVALAGNGQVFAVVQPAYGDVRRWQTAVHRAAGDRGPITLGESRGTGEAMPLSDDGRFIVRAGPGNSLELDDLSGATPVSHQQSADSFLQRHGCISAVLDSGHVLVADERVPRMGLYAAVEKIPRVATLPHDGTPWCWRLAFNAPAARLLLADALNRVVRIDATNPSKPVLEGPWSLPPRTVPLAAAGPFLYAASPASRLLVLRWDRSSENTVDWRALDAAHRVALEADRRQSRPGQKTGGYLDVVRHMEDAGVLPGLAARVDGVTPQRAAEILNDYGFWVRHDPAHAGVAEQALRRAIELDPGRAVARLNLGDWLVAQLPSTADPATWQSRAAEIEALYTRYLALGGRAAHVRPYLQAAARARKGGPKACEAIASHANAGHLQHLIVTSATGVAMGERQLDLVFTTEGTAHVPMIHAFDAATDEPFELSFPDERELWGGDQLGLVRYREGAHVLHYRDARHPVMAMALGDEPYCGFRTVTQERTGPKAVEPELCRRLSQGKGPDELVFDDVPGLAFEPWRDNTATTYTAARMRELDLANDGRLVNVAEVHYDSTAGAGCSGHYFDILDADGHRLGTGPLSKLITELQAGGPGCGNYSRFFRHAGKTYLEKKPAVWPPRDDSDRYHRVARIERDRVVEVCDFQIESKVTTDR